jgi:molybdopterin synthase catalytic subunit
VVGLHYEAWPSVAERELAAVEVEAMARWPGARVVIVHRTGEVPIGAPAVVVAVGAPHRAEAYEASRFAIDALKARVPLWKQERYDDGSAWIGNRP